MSEPTTITLAGTVEIAAAADPAKPKRFTIAAYQGGPVNVGGFSTPVILDLSGMKSRSAVLPILHAHDVAQPVGVADSITIDANGVRLAGRITGEDSVSQNIVSHAKNGFQWGASVGASIVRREFVPMGESAVVNGRNVAGPILIARESTLHEVSIVSIGADASATTHIAAKGRSMSNENQSTEFATALAATRDVTAAIDAACIKALRDCPEYADAIERVNAQARAEKWDANATELALLRACRPDGRIPNTIRGGGYVPLPDSVASRADWYLRGGNRGPVNQQTLEAALLLKAGQESIALKGYGEQTVTAARNLRVKHLADIAEHALRLEGREAPENPNSMLKAAFSTYSLPNALSNAMNKSLWSAYQEHIPSWTSFARVVPAADFKQNTGIRPSDFPNLEPVGGAGEIKHATWGETAYTWQLATYAKMFAVSRQDIVNDDTGFLTSLPQLMAVSAQRTLSDLIWGVILANAGSFFSSGNANLLEASSALDVTSLGLAISSMRSQRDANDNDLDIAPGVLVVSPGLEQTARQLLNSEFLEGDTGGTPTGNPLRNSVELAVEPRIANDDKFAQATATQWYLFSKNTPAVVVGFLDGRNMPTIESEDTAFNTLGQQWRCYFDFGASLADFRGALKASGAGGGG